ncbi:O-antigen/teichoic acid export membrane protein [Motilibacter rhizosphaerae]|uniref:O-antigen/teichoic acid export membrane protein n=1 Tax=Motilibacter rhizosphaerae TaxID=598652 RepID=A0A4Q7NQG3_9ACTN|nr:polysaccharide biosynthesis C-terminal domain-containing protein [Motilibacter rhizosphaerae]RZS87372.1 O-antigen/teichoic acid export membrane protein [Motilibacter rhizosphaerae]
MSVVDETPAPSASPEDGHSAGSAPEHGASLAKKVAGSAVNMIGRRVLLLVLSAVSTAALTRGMGPAQYGAFASALAVWTLLMSAGDTGFALLLGRDLAVTEERGALLSAAYRMQAVWAGLLTAVQLALAFAAGLDTVRGQCMLAFAVSVPFVSLNSARQVFTSFYKTGELVVADLAVTAAQVAVVVVGAVLGAGPVFFAGALSAGSLTTAVAVALMARRHVALQRSYRSLRRRVLRGVFELGGVAFMSRVYVSVDLILLGWLSATQVAIGQYAVATKVYTLVGTVPSLIVSSAMPALAALLRGDRVDFDAMLSKLWHWLLVLGMPVYVVSAVGAPFVIHALAGSSYDGSSGMLRILSVVGLVSVVNGFLGTVLVVRHMVPAMLVQNALAIVVNVVGNVVLVPRYDAVASAWVTLATELLICTASVVSLRRVVPFGQLARVSGRPLLALALSAAAGAALVRVPLLSAVLTLVVLVISGAVLGALPPELSRFTDKLPGPVRRILPT